MYKEIFEFLKKCKQENPNFDDIIISSDDENNELIVIGVLFKDYEPDYNEEITRIKI